jgi:hypothetical protein
VGRLGTEQEHLVERDEHPRMNQVLLPHTDDFAVLFVVLPFLEGFLVAQFDLANPETPIVALHVHHFHWREAIGEHAADF